ncbi:outer membrane beta-barrel domain-containing protein [Ideonella sp. A 288]|uniref:outer membrane beta-barrel domain-containing protein n=1 Tax=Ideonella sp. A 288 TaxID=1962181 RepID=UPI000B4AAF2B|nr:outer membrane beta-barrel domain-containing protein [Ideonella sp. A 288]
MRHRPAHAALIASLLAATVAPWAQAADNEPVIQPQVQRRELKLPRIPSNDFEAGLFVGTYATQNFGSSAVAGVRLGYHLTEDFFAEATIAGTQVSDESFRQILPGGVFPTAKETLSYANLSAGWNVLPGEVFFGRHVAKASSVYLIGGIGTTRFAQQRRQTINVGLGLRLFLRDWAAIQVDMRDHVFSLDLLGKRQTTQNLELTTGVTFFF